MTADWDAELTIDEPLVRRLLQSQFADLADRPLRLLGEGWDCSAWLVDEQWVFRLPRRQLGAECLENEIRVLPGIANRLPLPVSIPRLVGRSTDEFPWSFAACRLVPGESVCDAGLDDSQRVVVAEQLGEFLRVLHSIDGGEAESLGAPPDTLARLDVTKRTDRARQALSQAGESGLLGDDLTDRLGQVVDHVAAAAPRPQMGTLVHGDLYSRHVMTESCIATGIIDWGDVHVGDPAVDLAAAWTMFAPPARDAFRAVYGPIVPQTRDLALLRAVGHSLSCLLYAHAVSDDPLFRESLAALRRVADD